MLLFQLLLLPLFWLTWQRRDLTILILAAALSSYVIRFNIGSIPTTWLEIGIWFTLAVMLLRGDWRVWQKIDYRKYLSWLLPLCLWLLACFIGVIVATDTRLALGVWKGFIITPLLFNFLIITFYLNNNNNDIWWKKVIAALLLGAVGTSILAWLQSWLLDLPRLQSGFDSPNTLAMYLNPILVAATVWFFLKHKTMITAEKYFWLGGILILAISVLLTNSQTAVGAVLITLCFVVFLQRRPSLAKWFSWPLILSGLIIIGLVLIWPYNLPSGHINPIYNISSREVRMVFWSQAFDFIKQKPFTGLGLGQWQPAFISVAKEKGWLSIKNTGLAIELHYSSLYPHNLWLTTWLATGFLGLLALMFLFFKVLIRIDSDIKLIWWSVLVVQLLHGILDTTMWRNDLAVLFWLPIIASWSQDIIKSIQPTNYAGN